jgi:Fe-S cluster assembly ATPase SufC
MDIVSNAAVFAVMGTTGSGKSTFIQKATGSPDIVVGHNLKACEKTL